MFKFVRVVGTSEFGIKNSRVELRDTGERDVDGASDAQAGVADVGAPRGVVK